jgi:hypothetical protein
MCFGSETALVIQGSHMRIIESLTAGVVAVAAQILVVATVMI